MKNLIVLLTCLLVCCVYAEPPREIPEELLNEYTLDGQIQIKEWYIDGTYSEPKFYSKKIISDFLEKIRAGQAHYYGNTDTFLYRALEQNITSIKGKRIGVLGSTNPWYESVILYYGGIPITIDYNKIETDDSRLTLLTVDEYKEKPQKFDAVLSISSFEHDGLGRYGDPLDPNGDLKAMKSVKEMLKSGGLLFLAVPLGPDAVIWNAHREYGDIRLPMLLDGWKLIKSYGFDEELYRIQGRVTRKECYQPIFVLSSND
ncbi:MAG: hypothetical protein S4CHLAM20_02800 [Chlamydiia bacterium]|nr:hypothetical protein [Chlamydiia bacterium]